MDGSAILIYSLIAVAAIVVRAYLGSLDRERIRKHVEGNGGKVLDIESSWVFLGAGWRAGNHGRLYKVHYTTHRGRTFIATCATTMLSGVWWPREAPPGLDDHDEVQPGALDLSPEEAGESLTTPAEAITCLSCGAKINARQTHCPHCGWSYEGR